MTRAPRLFLALAVSAIAGCSSTPRDDVDVLAAGAGRRFEGWLSATREHQAVTAGSQGTLVLDRDAATAYSRLAAVDASRSTDALLKAAAAELIAGRTTVAAARVSEAIGAAPGSWAAWNDHAVLELLRASETAADELVHLAQSIDAAMKAAELDPQQPQPWFNLARALARAELRAQAADAVEHLRRLTAGPWADEAARALEPPESAWPGLRAQLIDPRADVAGLLGALAQFSGQVHEVLLLELFPRWAAALRAGDAAAAATWRDRTVAVSAALRRLHGDALLSDCAAMLSAASSSAAGRAIALADAHAAYAQGRKLYEENRREEAQAHYAAAERQWRTHGSPCAAWPRLELAIARYNGLDYGAALSIVAKLAAEAASRGHHALHARVEWMRATTLIRSGDFEGGYDSYRRAIALYEKTGDTWNLMQVHNAAADGFREGGLHATGWRHLSRAVRGLPGLHDVRRRYLVFYNASLYSADTGLQRAAVAFQNGAFEEAEKRAVANTIVEARVQRARRQLELGAYESASRELDEAERRLPEIPAASSAAYIGGWVPGVRAELLARSAPQRALALIDPPLLDFFEKREPPTAVALHRTRSRALRALGRPAEAAAALHEGVGLFETIYRRLTREPLRAAYLDTSWGVFEDLIALGVSHDGQSAAAFEIAERARIRLTPTMRPVSLAAAARSVPADAALIYFVSLDDSLLVWTVARSGHSFRSIAIGRSDLGHLVAGYRRLIEAGAARAELAPSGARLFDSLIDTAFLRSAGVSRLLVVADAALHGLPFAALVDPASKRFLIEDRSIELLPSARWLAAGPAAARAVTSPPSLLAIGAVQSPDREHLPDAVREIGEIARRYTSVTTLEGDRATASAVAALAPQADVIHFAGHARADLAFPWASHLVLAPDASRPDGLLRVEDMRTWRLPRTRLVVLGACETALGAVFRGEGAVSLAHPFLRAGAGAVVGTIWEADDRATRRVMTTLHARFTEGARAGDALHAAQIELLRRGDPTDQLPRNWSGFVVIGSGR